MLATLVVLSNTLKTNCAHSERFFEYLWPHKTGRTELYALECWVELDAKSGAKLLIGWSKKRMREAAMTVQQKRLGRWRRL